MSSKELLKSISGKRSYRSGNPLKKLAYKSKVKINLKELGLIN